MQGAQEHLLLLASSASPEGNVASCSVSNDSLDFTNLSLALVVEVCVVQVAHDHKMSFLRKQFVGGSPDSRNVICARHQDKMSLILGRGVIRKSFKLRLCVGYTHMTAILSM